MNQSLGWVGVLLSANTVGHSHSEISVDLHLVILVWCITGLFA